MALESAPSESTIESLADLAYDAATQDRIWPEFLRRLGQVLRADALGLFRHDLPAGAGLIEEAAGIGAQFRSSYASPHGSRNIWLREEAALVPGAVFLGAEIAPVWELVRCDFYRRWLRPQGALHALIGVIGRAEPTLRCLIALRGREASEFEAGERAHVAALLPHLRRASGIAARVRQENRRSAVLLELLNRMPEAIVLIDRERRVHLQNLAAGELLYQGDGLRSIRGRLCGTDAQENRRLQELAAAKAGSTGASEEMLVTRRLSGGCPLLVTVSSLRTPLEDGVPLAVVATRDSARSAHLSAAQLRRLLPLTPAEAALAALILRGYGLLEAAVLLHVSKNTARTHMKRIYAKTNLHRQPDLQRLLDLSVFEPRPFSITPGGDDAARFQR